ncbi:MAG: type II secretion system major pseudopilin GspG [Phycisphaerae bacterium]
MRNVGKSKARRMRRGFTLLEILLVVGLLALLAAFAIPALQQQGERAKIKLAQAAVKSGGAISKMVDQFNFDCGKFPESLKELSEKPSDDEMAKKWGGPYIKDIEGLMDPWGHEYVYQAPGTHNEKSFDLSSMGPDGKPDTEDDIRNWKTD